MAISDTINAMRTNIESVYSTINNKGGTVPQYKNLLNMPAAINSIPSGGGDSGKAGEIVGKTVEIMNASDFGNATKIGNYAFHSCPNLSRVELPSNITQIGDYSFYNDGKLVGINIPSSVTNIGQYAFYNCSNFSQVSFENPSGLYILTGNDFANTAIRTVDLPVHSTRKINLNANVFTNCSRLTTVNYSGDYILSIGPSCFQNCSSLVSFPFDKVAMKPYSLDTTGQISTFRNCSSLAGDITLNFVNFDSYFMGGCSKISSLTLANERLSNISNNVFNGCSNLSSITINALNVPKLTSANALANTNNCTIYVPADLVDAYKGTTNWSVYSSRIQAKP